MTGKPVFRYSVSKLQSYASCGLAYKLGRIDRVPQRTAMWFIQGLAVHEAVEAYEKAYRGLSVSMATTIFEAAWNKELESQLEAIPDKSRWTIGGRSKWETDRDKRHDNGVQQVIDYITKNPYGANLRPTEIIPGEPATEVGFAIQFEYDDFTIEVIGYIDLLLWDEVNSELLVRDLKTGAHVPADPYQLATYAIAVKQITGRTVSWGDWWMAKDGKASLPFDLRNEELYGYEAVKEWYRQLHLGVAGGVFLGNPGDACFTCMSKDYCPMIPGSTRWVKPEESGEVWLAPGVELTPEDPVELLEQATRHAEAGAGFPQRFVAGVSEAEAARLEQQAKQTADVYGTSFEEIWGRPDEPSRPPTADGVDVNITRAEIERELTHGGVPDEKIVEDARPVPPPIFLPPTQDWS